MLLQVALGRFRIIRIWEMPSLKGEETEYRRVGIASSLGKNDDTPITFLSLHLFLRQQSVG